MKRARRQPQQNKNEKRINHAITARELIVVSSDGEMLGKMSRDAAISLAESKELDLVEMGMQDGLPLAKIIDYGKYLFKQKKQQSQNRSQTKKTDVKAVKLTYKIGAHDLDVRRKQAEKWAKEGNPIKVFLQLRGRENQYEDLAIEKIEEFIVSLDDIYRRDEKAKITKQGNTFNILLYPKK